MSEIQTMLDSFDGPQSVKLEALTLAFQIAGPIAFSGGGKNAAIGDGTFLKFLMELLKVLLPILLGLLKPK